VIKDFIKKHKNMTKSCRQSLYIIYNAYTVKIPWRLNIVFSAGTERFEYARHFRK